MKRATSVEVAEETSTFKIRMCEPRCRAWFTTYRVDVEASKARPRGRRSGSSIGSCFRRSGEESPGVK